MSRLAQKMAALKASKKAVTPAPKVIVEPTEPKSEAVPTPTTEPTTEPTSEVQPATSFIAPAKTNSSLTEISTTITEALSEADEKVAAQRAAGVYDLPEEAHKLMGTEADRLITTMQSLDAALVEKTPEIRTLSFEIRKNLEQYPELTHILTDEQLHIMVQGYLTIANVKTAPKTKAAKTKAASKKADSTIKALGSKSASELF